LRSAAGTFSARSRSRGILAKPGGIPPTPTPGGVPPGPGGVSGGVALPDMSDCPNLP
jgi:hypothetical protein